MSIKGQGRMFVDFEFIPHINEAPHLATLTVDPGVLWRLNHGFTTGFRATFNVNSSSIGFVPILNKSWKLHDQTGFFRLSLVRSMSRSLSIGLLEVQQQIQ